MGCNVPFKNIHYQIEKAGCEVQIIENFWVWTPTRLHIGENDIDNWSSKGNETYRKVHNLSEVLLIYLFLNEDSELFFKSD